MMSLVSPLLLLVTLPLLSFLLAQINFFTLPVGVENAISSTFSYLSALDFIIPISTVSTLLVLALVFQTAIILFKASVWLIRHVRGV